VRAETALRGKEGNERGRHLEGLDGTQAEPAPGCRTEKGPDESREAVAVAAVGPVPARVDPGKDDLPRAVQLRPDRPLDDLPRRQGPAGRRKQHLLP